MAKPPLSDPRYLKARAALEEAVSYQQQGNLIQSEKSYRRVIEKNPNYFDALHFYGLFKYQQGQFNDALKLVSRAAKINPRSTNALNSLGVILGVVGRHTEALASFDSALALDPNNVPALCNRGNCLSELRRYGDALANSDRAIAINPNYLEAYISRGAALLKSRRHAEALDSYERAIKLNSNFAVAWIGRGHALVELNRIPEALTTYDKVLALAPVMPQAWIGRGNASLKLKLFDQAREAYDKALALKPELDAAWLGRGNLHLELKNHSEALAAYDRALALKPDLAEAWNGRGIVYFELKRHNEALTAYDRALRLDPELAEAWYGRGNLWFEREMYAEAVAAYDKALALNPDLPGPAGSRHFSKLMLCDWSDFDTKSADLISSVKAGKLVTLPFPFLAASWSPAEQLQCAKLWVSKTLPAASSLTGPNRRYDHQRIRVAYLSTDFRDHPVAQALANLVERHDRSRFETIGLSIGPDDGSDLRARMVNAFDQFHDLRAKSDPEAARLIAKLEVDILVKVAPHTEGARLGILAHRPAPIQVNGFSAWTSGADFIDYVLADRHALPFDEQPYFSEQIVHLPDSYFPHDSTQKISSDSPSRTDQGLPESAFVFCSFNKSYKLNPRTFDIWMRLLARIEGSVLWLKPDNDQAITNLRREAAVRNVDPARLIFASRMPSLSDHLARLRLADLFLDTLPYGGHTTSKDALSAGLPVLTCRGDTFVGRIATSQLYAAGLPGLATSSLDEYETAALRIAQNPQELRDLRDKLATNRPTCPLFDTPRQCRHFEAAYVEMWRRHQHGEPPQNFTINPRQ